MASINKSNFMTAREVVSALGISRPTLYSYVSRGMLRSERVAGKPRIKHYPREDVMRLAERKEFRRNPAKAAARGLHWGAPVLESRLTLISDGRLFYRGKDALELARNATVEDVAALLWTGDSNQATELFAPARLRVPQKVQTVLRKLPNVGPISRCQQALALAGAIDDSAHNFAPAAVARTGARILVTLYSAICGTSAQPPLDARLAATWIPNRPSAADAIRAALLLCADHELNVSAFTARCIASAQATPYEAVLGALAAFSGRRHGGASQEIKTLLREAEQTHQYRHLLATRLRLSGNIPGFGHPLYPSGDPRASLLLQLAEIHGRRSTVELAQKLTRAVRELTGEYPNLDFGLVVLGRALDLPSDAPMILFALGRSIGWIAHAMEQYADIELIRPRASYVGPAPSRSAEVGRQ